MSRSAVFLGVCCLGFALFGCKSGKEPETPRSRLPRSCQMLQQEVCQGCGEGSELCKAIQRAPLEKTEECEKAVELVRNEKRATGRVPEEICASSPKSRKEMSDLLTGRGVGDGSKVSCKQMCERTFIDCLKEVLIASGQLSEEKLAMAEKAGLMKDMKKKGYDACMKNCKDRGGVGGDAPAINRCLGLKSCEEYAECINKHLN